jgi:hypothetical protein
MAKTYISYVNEITMIKPWTGVVKSDNKMVRAKFVCNVNKDNGSTDEAYKGSEIHLSAVYSGSPIPLDFARGAKN